VRLLEYVRPHRTVRRVVARLGALDSLGLWGEALIGERKEHIPEAGLELMRPAYVVGRSRTVDLGPRRELIGGLRALYIRAVRRK